ncbi:hypothetical protein [Rhodopirellula islandica]|uniref:hypothetical protein n=1 Tax=Rhodopirellula islandica TaxID=595434 RepID=UPI00064A20E3|nr:hypothetical protein [Rhodopirellula islandica]
MNFSDWIAFSALLVSGVGLLVTIVGLIWGPRLHAYFHRIVLTIELKNQFGTTYQPKTPNPPSKHVRHIKISTASKVPAENVTVFLERIEKLDDEGEWSPVFEEGRLALKWQYEQDGGKRIGPYLFCNLVRIEQGKALHFVPQKNTASLNEDTAIPATGGRMKVWIQAVGDNGESPIVIMEINYRGGWASTKEEWGEILTISEPKPCQQLPKQ